MAQMSGVGPCLRAVRSGRARSTRIPTVHDFAASGGCYESAAQSRTFGGLGLASIMGSAVMAGSLGESIGGPAPSRLALAPCGPWDSSADGGGSRVRFALLSRFPPLDWTDLDSHPGSSMGLEPSGSQASGASRRTRGRRFQSHGRSEPAMLKSCRSCVRLTLPEFSPESLPWQWSSRRGFGRCKRRRRLIPAPNSFSRWPARSWPVLRARPPQRQFPSARKLALTRGIGDCALAPSI